MKTFKQLLNYIFEGKHDPTSEEERMRLLDLEHGEVSKSKDHKNYEDKVANALKGLNSTTHGKDTVKKYLQKFKDSPNRWIRMHVAKHPELHDHPEIHQALASDASPVISAHAKAERKSAKATTPSAPKKPIEKASPAPKPKVATTPKPKDEKPSGKMEVVPGDTEEFPYSSRVSHIMKGKKKLGTVVSGVRPSEMGNDEPFHHSYVTHKYPDGEEGLKQLNKTHQSHEHGLLGLVKHLKGI